MSRDPHVGDQGMESGGRACVAIRIKAKSARPAVTSKGCTKPILCGAMWWRVAPGGPAMGWAPRMPRQTRAGGGAPRRLRGLPC